MERRHSNKTYRAIRTLEASIQEKLKKASKEGTLKEYIKTDEYWRDNWLLEGFRDCR